MNTRALTITAMTCGLLLTGCSNPETTAAPAPTTPAAAVFPPPVQTYQPPPPPPVQTYQPPAPRTATKLGTKYAYGVAAVVTVEKYSKNVGRADTAEPGTRWDALLIRQCAPADSSAIPSWDEWSLSDTAQGRYEATSTTYRQFPTPEFPNDESELPANQCVSGWVVFGVNKAATISEAKFETEQGDQNTWQVS